MTGSRRCSCSVGDENIESKNPRARRTGTIYSRKKCVDLTNLNV